MTTFNYETLEHRIGHNFADALLLARALTHKSFFNETNDKIVGHNEKLEFLGDAVLDLSLSHKLMEQFPEFDEGHLSKLRASLVNEKTLAELAVELKLQELLRLGKGESQSGGREKPRLLASALEALIGAFYLDAGFEKVSVFVHQLFDPLVLEINTENHYETDYKTRLQEKTQALYKLTPRYEVLAALGPDHEKLFRVQVQVNGHIVAEGEGRSKKQAEQMAAQKALESL